MRNRASLLLLILIAVVQGSAQTPRAIESKILARLSNIDRWSNYGPTSDFDKLEKENQVFRSELLTSLRVAPTLTYGFPRLKGKMYVTTSKDGRLRIYSWDCQTGGTMHDFDAVYQYRGKSGKVYSWARSAEDESGGVFYHDIFQVTGSSGPVYLAVSTFIGSSSLSGAAISGIRIDEDKLVPDAKVIKTGSGMQSSVDFGYDFFTVVDRPERPVKLFVFDEAKREFRFPVVIEDEQTPQGRVTDKYIRYRFNGSYFEKVS
jgi:hypothetical protein